MKENKKRSAWSWIPTLYFAEGLPYVAVMPLAAQILRERRAGLARADNDDIHAFSLPCITVRKKHFSLRIPILTAFFTIINSESFI